MHRVPIHFFELVSDEDTLFVKIVLGQLFMHPVTQALPFVGGEFVLTEEDTNWL
jgi:hypothetical protein